MFNFLLSSSVSWALRPKKRPGLFHLKLHRKKIFQLIDEIKRSRPLKTIWCLLLVHACAVHQGIKGGNGYRDKVGIRDRLSFVGTYNAERKGLHLCSIHGKCLSSRSLYESFPQIIMQ